MTREQLTTYLDGLEITSENIGHIRRTLMVPFDCEWNAWVRDETAAREVNPYPPAGSIIDGEMGRLRQELSHVQRHRDFLEGELHKRDEQLDAVKIERDAAETRVDALKSELREAHGVVQIRDKRIEELESCGLVMDFAEQSRELEALRRYNKDRELQYKTACSDRDTAQSQLAAKDREILLLQRHVQDLAERNVNLRTAKVAAENELRVTRRELLASGRQSVEMLKKQVDLENKLNCLNAHIPREITALTRFTQRALDKAFLEYPTMRSEWDGINSHWQAYFSTLLFRVFEFLPQLDVTTRHPSGSSEPGDRNPHEAGNSRVGKSENGQTSIASEDR